MHSSSVRKPDKLKTEIIASSHVESGAMSPPPPLPPRTRALTTPPPPLPPRETQAGTQSRVNELTTVPSFRGTGPAPALTSNGRINQISATVPSATPPSSLEQLAEQTGFTTQQIHEILMQHKQPKRPPPPPSPQQAAPSQMSPSYPEHYPAAPPADPQLQPHQYQMTVAQHRDAASPTQNGGQPPPPPHYSSSHLVNTPPPPPPPYNTTHHQPSPASSVTSGSSNDYFLVNYHGYIPSAAHNGEYRSPAYGESPSSGRPMAII